MDKKTIGFVMTHGHMDIEWYMPLRSYRFWTVEALDELRRIAVEQPDCPPYVLDGVTYVLDLYLEARPEARKEMLQLIAEKKLSVGPFFSQFDEWLPSAEAIVRNCLYGNRKCREYGGIMKAGYLPDNFGHPMQLPQILRNFGIDSLLFMRGMPEIPGGHPDEFHYKGLDGSVVLASHFREGYDNAFDIWGIGTYPLQPRDMPYYSGYFSYELLMERASHSDQADIASQMIRNATRLKERYPSGIVPLVAGCDHCPPQEKMAQTVALANRMQSEIAFVMGDAQEYVEMVRSHLGEVPTFSMELIGSFSQFILFGALSTRSYLKRLHFGAEVLMERYTEPLDAIASLYGYAGERPQMDEAWKHLMINSAHRSIHGSSMDEVHTEMASRYAAVMQIATGVAHEAIQFLGTHMAPWWNGKGKGILAFSPANPGIPQLGQVWLPIGDTPVCIHDADGNALPTQVQPREPIALNGMGKPRNAAWPDKRLRNVLFLATSGENEVGSYVCAEDASSFTGMEAGDDYLENDQVRVEVRSGLLHLLDKETGVWHHGMNLLEEDADAGDAWDFSPPWTAAEVVLSSRFPFTNQLVESGPVRSTIEIKGVMSVPAELTGDERSMRRVDMPIHFQVSLERHARRVDVKLVIDNQAKDHRVRLRIPSGIRTDKVISQGHFGILQRPVERPVERETWRQPPTRILPFREWLAVDDGRTGLAIATKGLYAYEAVMNPLSRQPELYLTLVRGIEYMSRIHTIQREGEASNSHHTPGAQCLGRQVVEWSYLPYQADPEDVAPFITQAEAFL